MESKCALLRAHCSLNERYMKTLRVVSRHGLESVLVVCGEALTLDRHDRPTNDIAAITGQGNYTTSKYRTQSSMCARQNS